MARHSELQAFAQRYGLCYRRDEAPTGPEQEYVYSTDGKKRYAYRLSWDAARPLVLWVMLNPGTGDTEVRRRNTLERCKEWSRQWGYGGLLIGNVFATRTRLARQLVQHADVRDDCNEEALRVLKASAAETIIAWGNKGRLAQRGERLLSVLDGAKCLGLTARGAPRHPLYVPKATVAVAWDSQAVVRRI